MSNLMELIQGAIESLDCMDDRFFLDVHVDPIEDEKSLSGEIHVLDEDQNLVADFALEVILLNEGDEENE